MLIVNDLININRIPDETEISLDLLIDFYEQYLSKRVFIFTLKNGEKVKLFFKETSEIFHISGIDHIYEGTPMDGTRFINEIKSKKISLATVKNVNSAAYTDYIDRIRSMFCIDTIGPKKKSKESNIVVTVNKSIAKKEKKKNTKIIHEEKDGLPRITIVPAGNKLPKKCLRCNGELCNYDYHVRDK